MAEFLKLNGIDIPVAVEGADYGADDVMVRTRGMDGSLRTTRIATKRIWEFETPPLDPERALMIAGLVTGRGHHFSFDSDLFDLKGYGPLDTATPAVATRHTNDNDNKYGSSVGVDRATTNLLPANVRTGTDTNANTVGFTAVDSATLASSTAQAWQGLRSLLVTTLSNANAVRGGVQTDPIAAVAGATYAASVYVRSSGSNVAVRVFLRDTVNNTDGNSVTVTTSSLGWQRVVVKHTMGGGSPQVSLFVIEEIVDTAISFHVDGFQIEQNSSGVATSWVDGSRPAPSYRCDVQGFTGSGRTISEDLRNAVDMTIMCWAKFRGPGDNFGEQVLLNITSDPNANEANQHRFALKRENFRLEARVAGAGGANGLAVFTPAWNADNVWHHCAAVLRRNVAFGSDNNVLKLYFDGTLKSQATELDLGGSGFIPDFAKTIMLGIGEKGNGANAFDGQLDDVVIVPYALTAAAIATINGLGRAWSDLPRLEAEGDAVVVPPPRVIVEGTLTGGKFIPASVGGSFIQNNRTVEFDLVEV